ncbi:MAG TPA: ATP-binding protein [Verrucomicrobiae bacterium]|nr:ATP-binding protein [Verrucomicrobiae bacterium]
MKTLLVLAPHPELAETLRAGLSPEQYRIVHRAGVEEAEPLLAHGLANACIVDVELAGVQEIWILEKLRRRAPRCPIILFTGSKQAEWEEEAYLKGATHVFAKPVRMRMFTAMLERLWTVPAAAEAPHTEKHPHEVAKPPEPAQLSGAAAQASYQSLGALRGFSAILTHSLDADAMLKQFLLLLRELIGINRAAVFLHQPVQWMGERLPLEQGRRLRAACAIGVAPGLLEHFELSFENGIGGQVSRLGRILRRHSEEARRDAETQKEFELLGTQVAVPILDRETVVGVAVFDGHITGEPLANGELELIFHLLEQVGLAVKNIWLHDQLGSNHEMMAGILRELNNACVVVNRDLAVLHSNKTARRFFTVSNRRTGELEFSDLPQSIGAKVYQVLKTGTAIPPFKFQPEGVPGAVYNVSIVPFQRQTGTQPASALLMVEDLTQSEQFRRLELETANLRLVRTMADRLAHEIGNAMVPLSTHQQLLADKYKDPEFRASLDAALADGVKRVTRLINQMRFLARDSVLAQEAFPVTPLIEEAYQEARKHQPVKSAEFQYKDEDKPFVVTGDRAALKHALTEVIINALQANPSNAKIGVSLHEHANGNGRPALEIQVQDNGTGFTSEAAQNAPSPFFTTRNVGLGLGLTVSRKIIETHHGKLEIVAPKSGQSGIIRISLPVDAAPQG